MQLILALLLSHAALWKPCDAQPWLGGSTPSEDSIPKRYIIAINKTAVPAALPSLTAQSVTPRVAAPVLPGKVVYQSSTVVYKSVDEAGLQRIKSTVNTSDPCK